MRQVLEVQAAGHRLFGTAHVAEPAAKVGVLVLSPGHVARAGAGDMFPQIGDALARLGLPVFRFDFPGLGDCYGALPEHEQDYFRFIQEGGNVDCVRPMIDAIKQRFGLEAVILGGLCGGAITAILASTGSDVVGMFLLDPEFSAIRNRIPGATAAVPAAMPPSTPLDRLRQKLRRPKTWIRFATGENRMSRLLAPARSLLLPVARWWIGERPPSDSNFELIDAFQRAVKRRTRTLVITATGMVRELYYEQVEKAVRSRVAADCLEHRSIADTNHVFTAGGARTVVVDAVRDWAQRHFAAGRAPTCS